MSSANGSHTHFLISECVANRENLYIILAYTALNLLLLPLYLLVLFVGFKQWRLQCRQRALSGAATSDVLTYNLALMETMGCLSAVCFAGSSWAVNFLALKASFCLFVMYFCGEALFQCGICVDRYLAIVHPIAYRNLKDARAIRIRNVTLVVSWLFVASWIGYVFQIFPEFPAKELLATIILFAVTVLFCCLRGLYVLTRPGPIGKKLVDQTKLRAFHMILIITCLLLFKMAGVLLYLCVYILQVMGAGPLCVTLITVVIIITPASTTIPLLFLRRMKETIC